MKKLLISAALFIFTISLLCIFGCQTDTLNNNYTVTFIIDGVTYSTANAGFGKTISKPEITERNGYVFKGWYITNEYLEKWNFENDVIKDNITLYGYWLPETENSFNVLFYDGNSLIKYEKVLEGSKIPQFVPKAKEGYNFLYWCSDNVPYDLDSPVYNDVTLSAHWQIITYSLEFIADNTLIKECNFTVENKNIEIPAVPQKQHYTGEWENFILTLDNLKVNAVYTPVLYTATFIVDGNVFAEIQYTVEDTISIPSVPEKTGYSSEWSGLPVSGRNITITAVYTPNVYKVYFVAGGEVIDSINYTVENKEITPPAVPERLGFEGAWEKIDLETGDVYINAVYSLKNYKVTFIADNQIIAIEYYNIENMKITTPEIPQKEGYTAFWEDFNLLTLQDITVNANYNQRKLKIWL